jgi:hypothetical protein
VPSSLKGVNDRRFCLSFRLGNRIQHGIIRAGGLESRAKLGRKREIYPVLLQDIDQMVRADLVADL